MKSFALLIACFLLSITTLVAQSKDEVAISTACAAFQKAIIDGDKNALESLTLKSLNYGHSSGLVENQSQFITALSSGAVDFTTIDITDQTIQISGKNAIVRNIFKGTYIKEGKSNEIRIGVLMVWKNVKGNWKLLARQGYKI